KPPGSAEKGFTVTERQFIRPGENDILWNIERGQPALQFAVVSIEGPRHGCSIAEAGVSPAAYYVLRKRVGQQETQSGRVALLQPNLERMVFAPADRLIKILYVGVLRIGTQSLRNRSTETRIW